MDRLSCDNEEDNNGGVDLNERRVWWICEFFGNGGGFMGFYGLLVVVGLVVVVAGLRFWL